MKERGNILKLVVLIFLALAASFPALSATFYAGVVSETDLSKSIISDNWMGISGTVQRGSEEAEGFKVGELNLQANQTGEVLEADLDGIRGGGFYLVFLPNTSSNLQPSNLDDLGNSSYLEEDQVFSEEMFPSFYPNYTQKFDNPEKTFDQSEEIKVNGENFNASYANLSGETDMYLLRYKEDGSYIPAFVSPVDGLNRSEKFEECYVSGCNFQALLPRLEGEDFGYSVNLISVGEAVTGCEQIDSGRTSIVAGEISASDDCVELNDPNTYVDFYNTELDGDDSECGLTVSAENTTVFDASMTDFSKALCLDGADASVKNSDLSNNTIGVESSNSNLSAANLSIDGSGSIGLALQGSEAELKNVSLSGNPVYGEAESVSIQGHQDALPRPGGISDDLEPTGRRVDVESLSNESRFENFGIGYPDLNTSVLSPEKIYQYREEGGSYQINEYDADLIQVDWAESRYARYDGVISNFSVFTLYGEDQSGEQGSGEDDPTEGEAGGGGSSGDSGASGGSGSGGGGAGPTLQAQPEPVEVNLSLNQNQYNVNRGDVISVEFRLRNEGDVAADNITVGTDSEWTTVPKTFETLRPNESRSGTVLTTVPENAPIGNQTQEVQTLFSGATIDSEEITMNVSAVVDDERLNVVESPPFLNLQTSTQRYIGVQVENPTPEPIRNVEVGFRGDAECAETGDQTYSIPSESVENIQVRLETSSQEEVCNDALVLTRDGAILGYAPMRLEIERPTDNRLSVSIYLLVLVIWTVLLIYRLRNQRKTGSSGFV